MDSAYYGEAIVYNSPELLNAIEMRVMRWHLDQMNTTVFARQKRSDISVFVKWSIVLNDVNNTFIRISHLDLGEKLKGAKPIDGGWFNKGRVEGFQVQSALNVHVAAALCRLHGWVYFDILDERRLRSRQPL